MSEHPALQHAVDGPVTGEAAALAAAILQDGMTIDETLAAVAAHLLADDRVEVAAAALTVFAPEDETGWTQLGGRAWVREWATAGSTVTIVPPPGAGPEAALSMPWLSQFGREGRAVVLVDREALPPEAEQDRAELSRLGVRSLLGTTLKSRGAVFGSFSAGSSDAGRWPDNLVNDLSLLTVAVTTRLTLENSRRTLAEAIDTGIGAQLTLQNFFGAVGHELRTPVSAILGYTEALVDDAEHGTADDVAAGMKRDGPVVVRSCERLLTIVDSLLGAGRAMSADDQRQEVRLADAVADVVHWHRAPARIAAVDMQAVIDPSLAAWAHPSAVRQVLAHLLGNAIAHHRAGGGSVHLTAEELLGESGKPMVRVVVRDDGPGLTTEQLDRAFEPFVRFAPPTVPGSGLGLSLSRTIAEREGGAVRGESTPDGSSFWLELPAFAPTGA